MDGKGKYKNKQSIVNEYIRKYSKAADGNESHVIYCFDCDDYDTNREDATFLKKASKYCDDNDYELVWFCKDIESVYLKRRVEDSQKKKESAKFKAGKMISKVSSDSLNLTNYKLGSSNILKVLDKYLKRKP